MIRHHPSDETLLDYACGAQSEAEALATATHLHFCRLCRDRVEALEAVGGAMMDTLEPAAIGDDALDDVLARITGNVRINPPARHDGVADPETAKIVPFPLRRYVGGSLSGLRWKRWGRQLEEAQLPLADPGHRVSLLRIGGMVTAPAHGHRGTETTVVLAGGFHDGAARFGPGDMQVMDAGSDLHAPTADPEGCVCLVVLDGPIQLGGMLGRFVNPLMRL